MTTGTTAYEDFTDQLDEIYNQRTRTKDYNGRVYTIRCTDPYGAWVVETPGGGQTAEMFKQKFTTEQDAWKAVEAYEKLKKTKLERQTYRKEKKQIKEIEL